MIGYGHSLSINLMREVATISRGVFSFGSDESMITSVFNNWLAWALYTTPVVNMEIKIDGETITVPSIRHGENQVVIRPTSDSNPVLHYTIPGSGLFSLSSIDDKAVPVDEITRHMYYNGIRKAILYGDFKYVKEVSGYSEATKEDCTPDIGQIWMAFQPAYFNKWGLPYLWSTYHAHVHKHAWNFKDGAVQCYHNDNSRDEISALDRIFEMMPPPCPTYTATESVAACGGMASIFNTSSSTCISPCSILELENGQMIRMDQVRVGMSVKLYNLHKGPVTYGKIRFIIRTPTVNGTTPMCKLGDGCILTPNHPYFDVPSRVFEWPHLTSAPIEMNMNAVYNIVFNQDSSHMVMVGNIPCVTMGHGLTANILKKHGAFGAGVVEHDYFGDYKKICNDCLSIGQNSMGYTCPTNVSRDTDTGWVNGMR
jgi:hypothetical protein